MSDQSSFSMHKLVHAWSYDRLLWHEKVNLIRAAVHYLYRKVACVPDSPKGKRRLSLHLMASFDVITQVPIKRLIPELFDVVSEALPLFALFLDSIGRWFKIRIERFYFELERNILGEEHPDTISAMSNLANTLGDQGQLDEAAAMKKEVLEKRRRILGEEHPDTISVMNNLASTLGDQGQLDEAAAMFKEALDAPLLQSNQRRIRSSNRRADRQPEKGRNN
jgi:tetratricopeptide (TPR) repeat protein